MEKNIIFLTILSVLFSTYSLSVCQNIETNQIDDTENEAEENEGDFNANVGKVFNNFLQQDGGKALEALISGAAQNPDTASQLLSGIGSLMGSASPGNNNAGLPLDPALIGNVISMIGSAANNKNKDQDPTSAILMNLFTNLMAENQKKKKDQFDISSILGWVGHLFEDTGENPMSLLIESFGSFFGPEAKEREHDHQSHAYLVPPVIEKFHLYFDHFRHTELYKALWRVTGGDKIFNMFAVDGKFSFAKFFDRLENKSFRRHWINFVTKKITDIIAVVMDPERHKTYVNTGVSLLNGFLKSLDFPKATLFDITRPTETLTNLAQYFFKKYLNMQVEARQYVKPAVKYVEDIVRLAEHKGIFFKDGINSHELAQKLTDTLNLEIIEPVMRVWRAYRFAKDIPDCDKYVMCYINQEDPNEKLSLPGLKSSLTKSASLVSSWFLSQKTGTSFWTLYSTINDENDCSVRFFEKCNKFHEAEARVHQEYEHTEL